MKRRSHRCRPARATRSWRCRWCACSHSATPTWGCQGVAALRSRPRAAPDRTSVRRVVGYRLDTSARDCPRPHLRSIRRGRPDRLRGLRRRLGDDARGCGRARRQAGAAAPGLETRRKSARGVLDRVAPGLARARVHRYDAHPLDRSRTRTEHLRRPVRRRAVGDLSDYAQRIAQGLRGYRSLHAEAVLPLHGAHYPGVRLRATGTYSRTGVAQAITVVAMRRAAQVTYTLAAFRNAHSQPAVYAGALAEMIRTFRAPAAAVLAGLLGLFQNETGGGGGMDGAGPQPMLVLARRGGDQRRVSRVAGRLEQVL